MSVNSEFLPPPVHYKSQIPALFVYNAFLIASNGTESRVGSLTADWDRFFEWKRIAAENEPRRVSLEVLLRGTCDPHRFFDLLENFTLFSEHKAGLVKVLGQNHQFLGVNSAIHATLAARSLGDGRGGVFWQTQGSGKSFSMVFYAQKILRRHVGNWTFVVITDRLDLDDQIAKTFKAVGAVSEAEGETHASPSPAPRSSPAKNAPATFSATTFPSTTSASRSKTAPPSRFSTKIVRPSCKSSTPISTKSSLVIP